MWRPPKTMLCLPMGRAAAGYLARFKAASRMHAESDLRAYLAPCARTSSAISCTTSAPKPRRWCRSQEPGPDDLRWLRLHVPTDHHKADRLVAGVDRPIPGLGLRVLGGVRSCWPSGVWRSTR